MVIQPLDSYHSLFGKLKRTILRFMITVNICCSFITHCWDSEISQIYFTEMNYFVIFLNNILYMIFAFENRLFKPLEYTNNLWWKWKSLFCDELKTEVIWEMTTTVYQTYFWSKGLNVIGWGNEGLIKEKKKKVLDVFCLLNCFLLKYIFLYMFLPVFVNICVFVCIYMYKHQLTHRSNVLFISLEHGIMYWNAESKSTNTCFKESGAEINKKNYGMLQWCVVPGTEHKELFRRKRGLKFSPFTELFIFTKLLGI